MTTLLLVRHGETDWNAGGRLQGHTDRSLNDFGRRQAAALAQQLEGGDVAALYTSDLARVGLHPRRRHIQADRLIWRVEDYTGKYKGEQVEVALFGGEYQEGVLTAYCYVDEVAHIELNGHILVPLQNIASLHCSSRCDAQANEDWPPRGLLDDDGPSGGGPDADDR